MLNVVIAGKNAKLSDVEVDKFNKQYDNKLMVVINNTFHVRFFILDLKTIYHCGASLNRIGTKNFSINLLEDEFIKRELINYVASILK